MDGYCERVGTGLFAEPTNAITNVAFLVAAGLLVSQILRERRRAPVSVWILPALLAAVGLASLSFHTLASGLTAALDSLSILVFVLTAVVCHVFWMWGVAWRWAWLGAPAFLAFLLAVNVLLYLVGGERATVGGYIPALLGLVGMGIAVRGSALAAAKRYGGWLIGAAGVFAVSLTLRTIDQPICASFPTGTHFFWHCLNAVVLYLVAAPIVRRWAAEGFYVTSTVPNSGRPVGR